MIVRDHRYRGFARLAELHRSLIGQVDQKVGKEKAIMRKYIAAIDLRIAHAPRDWYDQWRRDGGMGTSGEG